MSAVCNWKYHRLILWLTVNKFNKVCLTVNLYRVEIDEIIFLTYGNNAWSLSTSIYKRLIKLADGHNTCVKFLLFGCLRLEYLCCTYLYRVLWCLGGGYHEYTLIACANGMICIITVLDFVMWMITGHAILCVMLLHPFLSSFLMNCQNLSWTIAVVNMEAL